MIATENGDTYFNYKDYADIKERFLSKLKNNDEYNQVFFERALRELKDISEHAILYRGVLIKLQKHLNQDGILWSDANHKGCKYINYELNKDFLEINSDLLNENTFKLFKEFEYKFRREKRRTDQICDLQYINENIFKKMNALYTVYDIFTSLYPKNISNPICKNFSPFLHEFKDLLQRINYNESINFKKKLENFINEIKTYQLATDKACGNNSLHIPPLKPDLSVETVVLRPPNPAPSLQNLSTSSLGAQSVTVDERSLHTNGLELSEAQSSRGREPAKETMSPKGSLQSADTQDNLVTLRTTEEEPSTEVPQPIDLVSRNREQSTLKARDKPHEQYARNLLHIKGQYDPKLSSHQGILEFPNTENEISVDKGYLRRVTDAVSGFMEGVDPVPVVGVSGGMGALFLLFRYTPVGTFFRGRGRRPGIPTRFEGVYPGFMTDFQGDGFFPNNQYNIAYGAE
ncbi:PIR protein [Plasmodium vivax]|nr:PIR protein [Plasmodium vivax]